MSVLVDSSAWISYFRGAAEADTVDFLIEEDLVVTNDLVLAELTPLLHMRGQKKVIALLHEAEKSPMRIDWNDITTMQILCLKKGINGVGIPDLMIAQNALQSGLHLLSLDKHFELMARQLPLSLYGRTS